MNRVVLSVLLLTSAVLRADVKDDPLRPKFAAVVQPFLERYCVSCHGEKKKEAELDLGREATLGGDPRRWEQILERLHKEEMPPDDAKLRPKADERAAVVAWIRDLLDREANKNEGDPGPVLARRLSNAEYDYTIRDLTGIDLRPTREFPVDPANQSGFDNSGESLVMSPALLKKYLSAARHVADHVVLKPDGFVFAPHPVVTDTDRDKYCVHRIVEFYKRHAVDPADYFVAAWKYRHREALGRPKATLDDLAAEAGLGARYLATMWAILEEGPATGPLDEVRTAWKKMTSDVKQQAEARRECERLRDLVVRLRKPLVPKIDRLQVKNVSVGSQPLVMRRNDRIAEQHTIAPVGSDDATRRFCRVFPDTFVVLERAPFYDPGSSPKGRFLSAGFHLMHGFHRDDRPLYDLVLDDAKRRELDALWEELHFITRDRMRQYKDFIFFERAEPPRFIREAEFDFARSEDKDAVSEAKMNRLAAAYLAKIRKQSPSDEALKAVEDYFASMSADIRKVERARLAAEPKHLDSLVQFAERAYRRPLSRAERDEVLNFYRTLRKQDDPGHEEALRDTLVVVLMSPHFCYRLTPAVGSGKDVRPLTDHELASRLSYFLWSSMPDAELTARAKAGDLREPAVLKAQTRRMLRDPRVRGLASEFAGNWLDFRRFEEHNAVDRQRFPSFTNDLRQAMFEEPIRYFVDVAANNRSVLDLLHGNDTFVNRPLAKHYGMPVPPTDEWVHVKDADRYGRGGILPMAVFQTKNAPGLRTSPVKRGYWVVRSVLGEKIPPPPPTVPELPKDEAKLGELTLPQLLARHREDKNCASCHRRFDAVGLVFEGFGPIGERREKDLGGRPVSIRATFPDGKERDGLKGLREYLRDKRQDDYLENLCRKLLAYGLGRSPIPSDRKTLDVMRTRLKADGYVFGSLVEAIVTSPQFLNRRGRDDSR